MSSVSINNSPALYKAVINLLNDPNRLYLLEKEIEEIVKNGLKENSFNNGLVEQSIEETIIRIINNDLATISLLEK